MPVLLAEVADIGTCCLEDPQPEGADHRHQREIGRIRGLATGMPERSLAQRYVDEGLRHEAHPLIQFLDGPSGRRASLAGRGLDVWEVIATIRENDKSVALVAEYLQVPAGRVEATVAYYGEHKAEIDGQIEYNEAQYERGMRARGGRRTGAARMRALFDEQLSPQIAPLL